MLARDLLSTLFGIGIYSAIALGMLAALVLVRGNLDAIARSHVLILSDAFTLPFFAATTIAMLFLALSSAATIAREREQGTLEALFYGPIDHASYVVAKLGAQIAAFLPMAVAIALLLGVYAQFSGLVLGPILGLELLLALFTAGAVAALGVALSALARGIRASLALFAALVVLFLTVHVGAELLSGIAVVNNQNPLLFARDLLIGLDGVLQYASPFGVFQNGVDALVRDDRNGYGTAIGLAIGQTALLTAAAVGLLRRRGVRR